MSEEQIKALEEMLRDAATKVGNKADFYSDIDFKKLHLIHDVAHGLKSRFKGLSLSKFYTEYYRVYQHLLDLEKSKKQSLKDFKKYDYIPWE